MVPLALLLPLAVLAPCIYSQSPSSSLDSLILSSAVTSSADTLTSSLSGLPGASSLHIASTRPSNATATTRTAAAKVTDIVGITPSRNSANATASRTRSDAARPTVNTQPCNGYVEFCDRKFSNVSMVVAHNSPFVKPHNAASNQMYPVLTQLRDGIRGCTRTARSHVDCLC